MNDKSVKEAYEHLFFESHQENIITSLQLEFERIQKAHDAIHKFLFLQPSSAPDDKEYFEKSAFLTMASDVFELAHRSNLDALTGYYNAAFILLRSVYELVIRGALFECLSKEKYRTISKYIGTRKSSSIPLVSITETGKLKYFREFDQRKTTLSDWLHQLISIKPSIKQDLRDCSVSVYDKLEPILNDREFQREFISMPSFRAMVRQLVEWNIIDIPDFLKLHDVLYDFLSRSVHVLPDRTDAGRRTMKGEQFWDVEVSPSELNSYLERLTTVLEIAIIVELNIMKDWIQGNSHVKVKLKDEVNELEKLGLIMAARTLRNLLNN